MKWPKNFMETISKMRVIRLQIVGIVLVAIFAATLGYLIGGFFFSRGLNTKSQNLNEVRVDSVKTESETDRVSFLASGLPRSPAPNASDQEKTAFVQTVRSLAERANRISIKKECRFSPKVVRVKEKSNFNFFNEDSVKHTVYIYMNEIEVPPQAEKNIKAQFTNGPGIYGIGCDTFELVGFMEVES